MTSMRRRTIVWLPVLVLGAWPSIGFGDAPSYTAAQANQGRRDYATYCSACHKANMQGEHLAPGLVGARFDQSWRGKSLDVLSFHVHRMPNQPVAEPGSLSEETYTNILAHILKSNGLKPADAPLPSEMAALKTMTIPLKPGMEVDVTKPGTPSPEQAALLNTLTPVTDAMLNNPPAGEWLRWGHSSNGQNFSPLNKINKDTVKGLRPAWRTQLQPGISMSWPVVHQGVMYVQTFPDTVLAVDATNGDILWRYQYKGAPRSSSKLGLGLHGDKVFVPTSDQHVLALNAKTGELIWDHAIDLPSEGRGMGGYNLRTSPFVIGDKVIQGVTASFMPKGGFILALDVDSGDEVWRFNTIARPGEYGGDTWNDVPLDKRSGGSVWHQISYDPDLNLIYFGAAPTYDTGPLLHPVKKEGVSNEALYTNCTLALNPDTGELVWHYQHLANDQWDLDWVFERQLVTVPVEGKPRKVVLTVGKIAVMEALDAETGEYLFSVDTGVQNFITNIDPKTGAKTIDPAKLPSIERPCEVCPSAFGARAWPPDSYSPQTKYLYVPITESCMVMGQEGMRLLTSGVGITPSQHPGSQDGMIGRLQAIDVANQKLAWNHDEVAPLSTGTLATAGGLVFCGDLEPSLKAYDDATGEVLWQANLDDLPTSGLVTYEVDGVQYVTVLVGMSNLHVQGLKQLYDEFLAQSDKPHEPAPQGGAALWTFALQQ